MLTGGIRLGSLFGFEIRIDVSWFIIFFLVLWTLAQAEFPRRHPDLSTATYAVMGLAGAVLFFLSVLLHELAHSAVARSTGIEMEGITLFIFGGVARTRSEPETPKQEFMITVVGPLSSFAIGFAFLAIAYLGEYAALPVSMTGVANYLALVNFILAGFNLVPGFPLDGGRLFRSLIWYVTDDLRKATRWASLTGRGFGLLIVAIGVLGLFTGATIGGIWFILIGWFLAQAAEASYRQLIVRRVLEHVRVRDAMTRDPETVRAGLSLQQLVDEYFMKRRYGAFPVVDEGGDLVGLITLAQVKDVDRQRWPQLRVAEVMSGLDETARVQPDDALTKVLSEMEEAEAGRALVVSNGDLIGLISRSDISQWLKHYQQLN